MAFSKKLKDSQLSIVDERISELLPQLIGEAHHPSKIEAGEVFSYYMLGFNDIRAQKTIHESAVNTGHFIHLLYADGRPYFHAVSGPDKEKEWDVHAVMSSDLSYRLDEAIGWADQNLPQDIEVAVLHVPALYLNFLWLLDPVNPVFYALTWQSSDAVFTEQRRFTEHELRKVLFSMGGPRGLSAEK
jgi:hypothetical protein